jgi:hypothetical protein
MQEHSAVVAQQAVEKLTKHALRRKMLEKYGSWFWARRTRSAKAVRVEHIVAYRALRARIKAGDYVDEVNARGNIVHRSQDVDVILGYQFGARYGYDQRLLQNGWQQYDTDQDAPYFGCWVHVEQRKTMAFVEGDRVLVECPTLMSFAAELLNMERFYGPQPPAFVHVSSTGAVTGIYQDRPSA